jgi:AAA+ ATPase superfamily predicted ATPase
MGTAGFAGREVHLQRLAADLDEVRSSGAGRLIVVRGRRRVGKSRLVQEFLSRAGVPNVFFQASKQPIADEIRLFSEEIGHSTLPAGELVASGTVFSSWTAAVSLIASQATPDQPAVVVIDEFPYLLERDPDGIEGAFQKLWDRHLDDKSPVMLVLVGSDLAMMESLGDYGRPLHGRPTRTLVVEPFSPSEVRDLLGLDATGTLDAYLIAGGFPLVSRSWKPGTPAKRFLRRALEDPTSPLIVDAERMLAAEFPSDVQASDVLGAIGSGERTFTNINRAVGIPAMSLKRSLDTLVAGKRVVSARRPLSTKPSHETRYVVADPYLRFWLRFVGPNVERIERGQGPLVADEIWASWESYRGTAIEPIVRESLARMVGTDHRLGAAAQIGGWWNRTNSVEVDLVGADHHTVPKAIDFVGSIKWREKAAFDRRDTDALVEHRRHVEGAAQARLLGVSRAGFRDAGLDVELGPDDIVAGW